MCALKEHLNKDVGNEYRRAINPTVLLQWTLHRDCTLNLVHCSRPVVVKSS